CARKNDSLDFW
nr:immunoglobulin heavy chain junction region [Macaca mulatta]MOV43927.1 immunoglobulin heavy chain junction region [Macaca mulatta]